MKPMTRIVIHSVTVLLMDGIIVKMIPLFAGEPLQPPHGGFSVIQVIDGSTSAFMKRNALNALMSSVKSCISKNHKDYN